MHWYKARISMLLNRLDIKTVDPYHRWNHNLFANISSISLPDELDRVIEDVSAIIGTWERVVRTVHLWSDDRTILLVNRGYILSLMFFCLQYTRESFLVVLTNQLDIKSVEYDLCAFLSNKDGDFRHIRNSIAHGNFEITDNGKSIYFRDRKWEKKKSLDEVELDSLIVFDILMSAFINKPHPNKPHPG